MESDGSVYLPSISSQFAGKGVHMVVPGAVNIARFCTIHVNVSRAETVPELAFVLL